MLDALEIYEKAMELCPPNAILLSNLLFTLNYVDGLSSAAIFDGHLRYGQVYSNRQVYYRHLNDLSSDRRLRIGYISPDFRAHSVALFFAPLLRRHDRNKFEVFLYADVRSPDKVTQTFRSQADSWQDIRHATAERVAQMVQGDGIDILIDLAGHTGNNLLPVLARKPAPVQVSWLGYPNTTGLEEVDYRIVDEITEPEGTSEACSTEKIVRLPNGFHCMDAYDASIQVGDPPCLEKGYIQFGSFNYLGKVNDRVVATWAAIIKQVPYSRLLLKARGLGDALAAEAYLSLFERYGVERERIQMAPFQATQTDHLNLYRQVDIALDTFPYNGTTTTCEALWMGVPVVTFLGDRHASRVSASLLRNVGHPELVGVDLDDYIRRAVALAQDPTRIRNLRDGLRPSFEASPLRDEAGFAQKFETALKEMWLDYCTSARNAAPA
jgi:predicted O-linked N-acetylglucosamine transferase (SPINDLY family)